MDIVQPQEEACHNPSLLNDLLAPASRDYSPAELAMKKAQSAKAPMLASIAHAFCDVQWAEHRRTLQIFTTEYDKGSVQGLMTKHVCYHCYVLFLLQPCGEALIAWHARTSAEVEGAQISSLLVWLGARLAYGLAGCKAGWLAGWAHLSGQVCW